MQRLFGNKKSNKSFDKLYQRLGLKSLKPRLWFKKPCHFYKILNGKSLYVYDLIPNIPVIFLWYSCNSYETQLFQELILSLYYIWVQKTWLEN